MATAKRHVDAGNVKHTASSTTVPYTFDRKEKVFSATYAGKSYTDVNAQVLEKVLYALIEESLNVPWQPVIWVKPLNAGLGTSPQYQSIGFELDRIWIARFPDGAYKSCQWDGMEKKRLLQWCHSFDWDEAKHGPFQAPVTKRRYDTNSHYLPYTEEMWQRLLFLLEKMRELRTQLNSLFEHPETLNAFFSSTLLALPEPQR